MNDYIDCYIGLGSNLADPVYQLKNALQSLASLPSTRFIKVSNFYHSSPYGGVEQPDFINAVAHIQTAQSAHQLLSLLQHIENQQGRVRTIHWGPRTLDLDLLLYGNEIIHTKDLTVPHPEIYKRNFVLYPLFSLIPDLVFPDGKPIKNLISECTDVGLQKLADI